MCTSRFAGRVLAHPVGGSLGESPFFETADGGAQPDDVVDIGSWRPIGAVVAAVVAGLGHGDLPPKM